jgi:peptide-methionine (S)-S-oxide reductase
MLPLTFSPLKLNQVLADGYVALSSSNNAGNSSLEVAILGGGCFWCLDAIFSELKGVTKVVSGYSGGHVPDPSYEMVCSGRTGHAEVVQITFDPTVISYRELLQVFFTLHDPTTPNRQGADVGSQYRSIILYHDDRQKAEAERAIGEVNASGVWGREAVTQLEPFRAFYPAEDYHQSYFKKNPYQPYCRIVIAPKVAKLRTEYLEKLRAGS